MIFGGPQERTRAGMKNLFESETVDDVLGRSNRLQPATQGTGASHVSNSRKPV
jgi:hypothetical protein